jgi:ribosome maturation factor RimP
MTSTLIDSLGYHLYDVMYVKEASEWFLRFFIEKKDGSNVDLDDCEKVSNALSDLLDQEDPIVESYNLEVSSCGLERHLREPEHFKWAVGKRVLINTFKPIEKQKEFQGVLKSFEDNVLTIELDSNTEVKLFIEDISASKILYNWEELENE